MQSYQVVEHGKPLQSVLRETPKPKGAEVLVRITHSGVCHSDLHIWDGYFDLGAGKRFYVKDRGCIPPFTMGHEPLGRVEALGPEASGVSTGKNYIVYPWIGCGKCAVCESGQDNYCLNNRFMGVTAPGAYATHAVIPDSKYLIDAEGIEPSFAATLACSGLTTYSAIRKFPTLGPSDWVVVLGCGGLGLVALSTMAALGIKNVIACDIDPGKLEQAKALGAVAVVNTQDPDAAAQITKISNGNVAAALDLVGAPSTAGLGIAVLRKGGRFILCGLFGGEITLPLPPIAQRAIGVIGSYVGNLQELKEVVALAKTGKLKPPPVELRAVTETNRTLDELKGGKILGRVVLDFGKAAVA
jgi:D-arabinose 1-dehydrogenase-like Zn-dependent alcohol dehydrogenase